jgi:hypothetical protein
MRYVARVGERRLWNAMLCIDVGLYPLGVPPGPIESASIAMVAAPGATPLQKLPGGCGRGSMALNMSQIPHFNICDSQIKFKLMFRLVLE